MCRQSTEVVWILAFLATAYSLPSWSKSPQEIFELAAPSIVVVQSLSSTGRQIGFGSGVVVSHGEVVTNCHVVKSGSAYKVKHSNKTHSATIHYADPDRDLCQLSVPSLRAPPAEIGSVSALKSGARVVAIGAPQGFELSISEGLVSSLHEYDGSKVIQTSAPISPGSSGGGLFNDLGKLVGITTLFLKDGQNLNFAVPVDWIYDLPYSGHQQPEERTVRESGPETELIDELTALMERLQAVDPNFEFRLEYLKPLWEKIVESGIAPNEWIGAFERAYWELQVDSDSQFLDRAKELTKAEDWAGLAVYADSWSYAEPRNELAWFYVGISRIGLSELHMPQGDANSETLIAIKALKQVVKLNSGFSLAWFYLGLAYIQDKNLIGANSAHNELRKLDSDLAEELLAEIKDH